MLPACDESFRPDRGGGRMTSIGFRWDKTDLKIATGVPIANALKMCVPSALLTYFYTVENLKVLPSIILC